MFKLSKANIQKQGNAIPNSTKKTESQSHGLSRNGHRRHSKSNCAVNQLSSSLSPGSRPEIPQQGSRSLSPVRKLRGHRRLASSPQELPASKLFQLKKNKSSSNIRGKFMLDGGSERGHGSHPLSPSGQGRGQGQCDPLTGNRQEGGNGKVVIENIENISRAVQFPSSESLSLSDEEHSTETQESEYKIDCSSKYTNQSYERLTCLVYKRKAGFSGLMKTKYAVASERGKHLGHMVHQNINLGLHMNKDFWKLGMGKSVASVGTINTTSAQEKQADVVVSASPPIKMWERRRLVLEGKHLMYFHEDADFEEEDYVGGPTMSKRHQLMGLQRLKDKFNGFAEHAHLKPPSQGAINNPKGVIDLVAEYATATVVPITPTSFAPTPYCLAIMVKSEVKWMLCFEDEKEITKWLRNLTKVALTQSVERFAKNRGKYYNAQVLKSDSGERKRAMSPIVEMVNSHCTPKVDNRAPVAISTHSTPVRASAISNRSILSTKTLMDRESCKIVVLVNSAFLYLFLIVEKALSLSHLFVFAVVNLFTWLHLRNINTTTRPSSEEEGGMRLEQDPFAQSHASSIQMCKNESMVSNISAEDFVCESPPGRSIIVSSPSFIERRKSVEDEDEDMYRPKAGGTTIQVQTIHESHSHEKQKEMIAWMVGDPSIIHLRGQDYLTTKKKFPSATSLYELVELDAFDSNEHVTDVGQRFQLPDFDYGEEGNWCAPDTLIISFALPTTAPKLGRSVSDGKGYIVCGYYRIRSEVRKALEIISNVNYDEAERNRRLQDLFPTSNERVLINGIKLWEKWCCTSGSDPEMQKRLKFIPRGENLKELGVPSWICRYNGKPMLIKRPGETSFVFSHPDERTLEIDVNLHPLPFMFKQAMSYLKDHYFGKMLMTFGFVIEGREEDELPEVLLGSPMHLDKPSTVLKSDAVFAKSVW